jgi:hypothetical protein
VHVYLSCLSRLVPGPASTSTQEIETESFGPLITDSWRRQNTSSERYIISR